MVVVIVSDVEDVSVCWNVVYAARITLCILIPEMNKVLKEDDAIKLHDLSVGRTMCYCVCFGLCRVLHLTTN